MEKYYILLRLFVCLNSSLKIVALNKTKERMRPYHVQHENEDPDIKKIKKVNHSFSSPSDSERI